MWPANKELALFVGMITSAMPWPSWPQVTAAQTVSAKFLPIKTEAERKRFFDRLSELFEPHRIQTSASIEDAMRRQCGFVDPYLLEKAKNLNSPAVLSSNESARQILLPPCPYLRFDAQISVNPSSTTDEFNIRLKALTGYKYESSTKILIDKKNLGIKVTQTAMNGRPIKLPYVARPTTFVLKADQTISGNQAIEILEKEFPQTLIVDASTSQSVNFGGANAYDLIGPATDEDGQCAGNSEAMSGISSQRLRELIEQNRDSGSNIGRVKILVIDTGIADDEKRLLLTSSDKEAGPKAKPLADNDGDTYRNNEYGISVQSKSGPPTPLAKYPLRGHGTNVAALALGGASSPDLIDYLRDKLELEAVQVIEGVATQSGDVQYGISGANLAIGLQYAQAANIYRRPPSVVNLSVQGDEGNYSEITSAIEAGSWLLVVAAGNKHLDERESTKVPFPISYKSALLHKMIVVGAFDPGDSQKGPAAFSNRGATWVDVLASGCGVDTLAFGNGRERKSGTSFSAPQVSFGGALLYYMGFSRSDHVKIRIMAAAEFDDRLLEIAFSAGRFNLERALLLKQSILVMRQEQGRSRDLFFNENPMAVADSPCADTSAPGAEMLNQLVALKNDRLAKIVGFTSNNERRLRFYFRQTAAGHEMLVHRECIASDGVFEPKGSSPLAWKNLIDYVPSWW